MRVSRIGLALVGALLAVGCDKDDGPFFAPQVPLAYTRFVNAIPDTGSVATMMAAVPEATEPHPTPACVTTQ